MFDFQDEFNHFKQSTKRKKLTEKISGKLNNCIDGSTLKSGFIDVSRLYRNIENDPLLQQYHTKDLIEVVGPFVCIPTYDTIECALS